MLSNTGSTCVFQDSNDSKTWNSLALGLFVQQCWYSCVQAIQVSIHMEIIAYLSIWLFNALSFQRSLDFVSLTFCAPCNCFTPLGYKVNSGVQQENKENAGSLQQTLTSAPTGWGWCLTSWMEWNEYEESEKPEKQVFRTTARCWTAFECIWSFAQILYRTD